MNYISKRISIHLGLILRKTQFRICVIHRFKSWKILFFGSDQFALTSLKALFKEKMTIQKLDVVVLSDKNDVYKYAKSKSLKIHFWPPTLTDCYDLGVVVSFGKLIPKNIIDYFPLGIINVHASLLPQYRGAMPIFYSIKNGDSVTGVTIMKIKPFKFDIGDIVLQESCSIGSDEFLPSLRNKLANLGAKCLIQTIENLPNSLEKCVPQSSNGASSAPKVDKTISQIHWDKMTAAEVYNLYRGLFGMYNLKTTWCSKAVIIHCMSLDISWKSTLTDNLCHLTPGTLEYCKKYKVLRVHCIDKPLYICSLQMGDKILTDSQFYNGYLSRTPKEDWVFK
ncbi:UNVERIFIED_CONTAM: hypothetical protein PYX00_004018 [Menopon gallinae]|uniref:Methionyl-tRNA formyltransferase, mitochondrial n=1 Tax=Menopon gallinae TaxID=328185 RepID=A0AAW2I3Q2_9NEOP